MGRASRKMGRRGSVRKILSETFKSLPENFVVYFKVDPGKQLVYTLEMMKILTKKSSCIYITLNRPYETLEPLLRKKRINMDNIYFVDCVTSLVRGETRALEKALFINPRNLTGLSMAINEFIGSVEGPKVVFFDSLSTLLVYNSTNTVEKFSHFLTNQIRLNNLKGIMLSGETSQKETPLDAMMKRFCDKVIVLR